MPVGWDNSEGARRQRAGQTRRADMDSGKDTGLGPSAGNWLSELFFGSVTRVGVIGLGEID